MRTDEFDYDLPEELIAQTPLDDRAASRLLRLDRRTGAVRHLGFRDIVAELGEGDLLVLNDTRVSALRLVGRKPTGGEVEALLLSEGDDGLFDCLLKPARRLQPGALVDFGEGLSGVVGEGGDGPVRRIRIVGPDWRQALARLGSVPLPPYVRSVIPDAERYQTVYASRPGSAAAPTAGLHFTPDLLGLVKDKGVQVATVTLNVSIDTFRPVQSDLIEDHEIHGETCEMPELTAIAINECQGRIVAVGTTSVRTIESFSVGRRKVEPGRMKTKIFITPGYDYLCVDAILTNFHMPRTTMLAMISAFVSHDHLFCAYREAVREKYRFLSFGDSMLIA